MGKNRVVHFEIAGLEFERTKKFFENVFEWEIQEWKDSALKYGMISHSGEGTIGGGIMETTQEYGGPFTVFYIQVDDLKTTLISEVKSKLDRIDELSESELSLLIQVIQTLRTKEESDG